MNQLIKVTGRQGLAYCKTNFLKVELFKHIMKWRIPSTYGPSAALGLFLPACYRGDSHISGLETFFRIISTDKKFL